MLQLPDDADRLFVVTDTNVAPLTAGFFPEAPRIILTAGETGKTLESVVSVWQALCEGGATRHSLVVNIGGGMVSDLGGFAAATFKRGIRYANMPTTLLGAVDAAIGGKTGFDFMGLKNEIGAFAMPVAVEPVYSLFRHLPEVEWLSGYGEVLKTALLEGPEDFSEAMRYDSMRDDPAVLRRVIDRCADYKRRVVAADPRERGPRKALNLGHTAGHAFEELCLEKGRPVPHGVAVAHGLLVSLVVSRMRGADVGAQLYALSDILKERFGRLPVGCRDHERLIGLMGHDKKNRQAGRPNLVLLERAGKPVWDVEVPIADLEAALDIYCDMTG